MIRPIATTLMLLTLAACSQRPPRVDFGVDLYLHPEAAATDDAILQAAIRKRIVESLEPNGGLVHVRVIDGVVFLSGSVRSEQDREKAKGIAENIDIQIDGKRLKPGKVQLERLNATK